jgi:hypothetical protein
VAIDLAPSAQLKFDAADHRVEQVAITPKGHTQSDKLLQ